MSTLLTMRVVLTLALGCAVVAVVCGIVMAVGQGRRCVDDRLQALGFLLVCAALLLLLSTVITLVWTTTP